MVAIEIFKLLLLFFSTVLEWFDDSDDDEDNLFWKQSKQNFERCGSLFRVPKVIFWKKQKSCFLVIPLVEKEAFGWFVLSSPEMWIEFKMKNAVIPFDCYRKREKKKSII